MGVFGLEIPPHMLSYHIGEDARESTRSREFLAEQISGVMCMIKWDITLGTVKGFANEYAYNP